MHRQRDRVVIAWSSGYKHFAALFPTWCWKAALNFNHFSIKKNNKNPK